MSWVQLIVLAVVQGITEFLPISSSGHLILVGNYFASHGGADQGLMIDVGTHLGTLAAVILYFRARVAQMFRGLRDLITRRKTFDGYLTLCLIIGTIPGVIGGGLIVLLDDTLMRHVPIIIATSIVFGALLWWVDRKGAQNKTIDHNMTLKQAWYIGLAQMVALIPGTSRSGITMTMARYLGYGRVEAARFSFLLSIPVTAAAALVYLLKMALNPPDVQQVHDFFIVAALSFVVALATIHWLLRWLTTHNFTPFVIYRFVLAIALLLFGM